VLACCGARRWLDHPLGWGLDSRFLEVREQTRMRAHCDFRDTVQLSDVLTFRT
jgi:hypothetical protein